MIHLRHQLPPIIFLAYLRVFSFAADAPSAPKPDISKTDRICALIKQLGDDRFSAREAAQAELTKLGLEAFDALTIAENDPDLEIAARAHYVLGLIEFDWVRDNDSPDIKEALADYDTQDADARRVSIRRLSENSTLAQIVALCRLARFEKSPLLSKEAAVGIMKQPADALREAESLILENLGASPRPAAEWLRVYLSARAKPEEAVAKWAEIVAQEKRTLEQTPEQSRPEIVVALLKAQVEQLDALGRHDDALATMQHIVSQESGETESLVELLHWLTDHKARRIVDELKRHFNDRFDQEPILMYSLAEAYNTAGEEQQARDAVDRALHMNPNDGNAHFEVARQLQRRGLIDWAEGEYRHVIEAGPPESINTLNAQFRLAEMFHDQLRELPAAEVLERCLADLEKTAREGKNHTVDVARLLQAIRGHATARLCYYRACHWHGEGDTKQEQELLEKAIAADPLDADVVIALYRLPNQSAEQRKSTEGRIASMARQYREQVAQNSRDPEAFNQLAWLLSNTERDQAEALRCSQESLKLRPNEAGLLDTLGRCYFALGDYENAVKQQSRAVSLESHSGLMRRQLELFKKKLAEKQGKTRAS